MNFECKMNDAGFKMFTSLCGDFSLIRADEFCGSDIRYTYLQETTNNNSVIDHIFLSKNLAIIAEQYFSFDNIVNFSDHLPIGCNIILGDKPKFNTPSRGKQCRYEAMG